MEENKVYIFDLATQQYNEAIVFGPKPNEMSDHTATIVDTNGTMLVFGGD